MSFLCWTVIYGANFQPCGNGMTTGTSGIADTTACSVTYVTGPGKTGLIYTEYTCLYYATFLLFCMCFPKFVSFVEFLMDLSIYDNILDIYNTDST